MTNNVPTNGAVQVNDVSVKVEPISKAPTTLLPSFAASHGIELVCKEADGTLNEATAPNSDIAQTRERSL